MATEPPLIKPEGPPVDVVVLGTFHFDNPGQDIANSQIDDVLAPKRQAEISDILSGLARFKPTKIAVESQRRRPGTNISETYPIYRAASPNRHATRSRKSASPWQPSRPPDVYASTCPATFRSKP
jgi:hypothetical protein